MEEKVQDKPKTKPAKVRLMIHKTETDPRSTHVPVSVNGTTYLIKRGEEVTVPASVLEVLKNALKTVYVQNEDGVLERRDVPSYPFSLVD